MLSDEKYKDYTFIWFFKDVQKYEFLNKNRNTKVVKSYSKEFTKYLQTAKYWFFNYKIADYIKPKKDQVFTQCWHGTPLKRLGYDLVHYDNQLNTVKEMKKRYKVETEKFSYFISPSKYASEVLYAPTYRANQHESGVGYVYKEEVDFEKMQKKLGDKFIILFRYK